MMCIPYDSNHWCGSSEHTFVNCSEITSICILVPCHSLAGWETTHCSVVCTYIQYVLLFTLCPLLISKHVYAVLLQKDYCFDALTYVGTVASQGRVFAHVHLPVCHSSMDVSLCTRVWVHVYMCLFQSLQYAPCVPALLLCLCLCALRESQIQRCSVIVCRILLNELLLNSPKVKVRVHARTCVCTYACPDVLYMHLCHGEQVDQRKKVGYKSSTDQFSFSIQHTCNQGSALQHTCNQIINNS